MSVEDILVIGAEALLNLLISEAINEIGLVWGVNGEVKKLKSVVEKIQKVLEDAEKKQVDDVGVRHWLAGRSRRGGL
ncbi:hypothetical protein Scep_010337 [Stephania cephalantha]|uniref:Disease resistance N-terminal domain-containing protein n=1 Tax=Stephania cephalantha TaxID=152367 RepID=A0AAP0JV94_9MAGN